MKKRIITAVVAILIVLPFIYFGSYPYQFLIGIVALLAYNEIINLKKDHNPIPDVIYGIGFLSMLLIIYTNLDGNNVIYGVTYARIIFTILGLLLPTLFYDNRYTTKDAFYMIGSVFLLAVSFNTFILVRDRGLMIFIYLILIPSITDIFAYFIGKFFGKHKFCPKISPNKTWEGFVGGCIFGTIIPSVFFYFFGPFWNYKIIVGTLFLSLMGVLGDLLFSKIKRENDIKDYSNILPGHGGILDRLDSSIVVFMTYIFLTTIIF